MIYPFKYRERVKRLESIGFKFVRYTNYVNERNDNDRNSKEI